MICHACEGTGTDISFGTPCSECQPEPRPAGHPTEHTSGSPASSKEEQMPAQPSTRKIDWKQYGAREASSQSDTWRPKAEGDTITAKLAKVDTANTKWGEKTVIELSDVADGALSEGEEFSPAEDRTTVWPTPGLLDALADSGADIGDVITITLDELVDTGKGNPFKSFDVELGS